MNTKLQAALDFYLIKLETEQLSSSTRRAYASVARQFVYFIEDKDALKEDLTVDAFVPLAQKFLCSERDGKASSINSRASAIKYFINASGSTCETLARPRTRLTTRESMTEAELSVFMQAARACQPRDKAIGMLFATTGIRLQECAALNILSRFSVTSAELTEIKTSLHAHHAGDWNKTSATGEHIKGDDKSASTDVPTGKKLSKRQDNLGKIDTKQTFHGFELNDDSSVTRPVKE